MKNIVSLGEKEIVVRQFLRGSQGELTTRGVIRARVVRADVQTLAFIICCSQRVTSVNVDMARIDGSYYVVGPKCELTLSGDDVLPKSLACPCCGRKAA